MANVKRTCTCGAIHTIPADMLGYSHSDTCDRCLEARHRCHSVRFGNPLPGTKAPTDEDIRRYFLSEGLVEVEVE